MATEIRRKLEIACVVSHPVDSAACATKDGAWWSEGPLPKTPKLPPVRETILTPAFVLPA